VRVFCEVSEARSIRDPAYELRRTPLPRRWVNKGKKRKGRAH
jgi:hypothetical protein